MKQCILGRLAAVPLSAALLLAACGQSDPEASEASDVETTSDPASAEASHGSVIDVDPDAPLPAIEITLEEDNKSGQNLFVELENFTVTPENASTDPVEGEGHLHLYVDGERTMRFYNDELHLNLDEGTHEVEVEISANNHSAYGIDGEPIRAAATIDVSVAGESGHDEADLVDVTDLAKTPSVDLSVVKDPKSGWNLNAAVENFDLSAANVGGDPEEGQGHLHLAVDGEMSDRLYGEWAHISKLEEGEHEISVMLVGNDHKTVALADDPIAASTTVTVTAEEAKGSDHGGHGEHDGGSMEDDDKTKHSDDTHSDGGHAHGESEGATSIEDGLKASDATVAIDFVVADNEVSARVDGEDSSGTIKVDAGSVVAIKVTSDVTEQVHLHGHDVLVDVGPDSDGTIVFTADIPGTLEVELEQSGTLLANLAIN